MWHEWFESYFFLENHYLMVITFYDSIHCIYSNEICIHWCYFFMICRLENELIYGNLFRFFYTLFDNYIYFNIVGIIFCDKDSVSFCVYPLTHKQKQNMLSWNRLKCTFHIWYVTLQYKFVCILSIFVHSYHFFAPKICFAFLKLRFSGNMMQSKMETLSCGNILFCHVVYFPVL